MAKDVTTVKDFDNSLVFNMLLQRIIAASFHFHNYKIGEGLSVDILIQTRIKLNMVEFA